MARKGIKHFTSDNMCMSKRVYIGLSSDITAASGSISSRSQFGGCMGTSAHPILNGVERCGCSLDDNACAVKKKSAGLTFSNRLEILKTSNKSAL